MAKSILALVLCLAVGLAAGNSNDLEGSNPIRKVVTMLQDMQKQVESEGAAEQKLFDEFMCYCSNGKGKLDAQVKTATAQIDSLTSTVEAETAQKSQMEQDVVQHKADAAAAEAAIKDSNTMREKEASDFSVAAGEAKSNIDAMGQALAALNKGLSASMLQTSVGTTLRNIVKNSPAISEISRDSLVSFLDGGESAGGSDQIIGIVEQMRETMEADLKESTSTEEAAKVSAAALIKSKEEELAVAKKAVEVKQARAGELAVSVTQAKADVEDTKEVLADATEMKANLAAGCSEKSAEWDERQKVRATEIQAISETVEMLNSDDALDLFKKTLPSPAVLLQVASDQHLVGRHTMIAHSKSLVRDEPRDVKLLMLKSGGKQGTKNAIQNVIMKLVENIEKKIADDDEKREYCLAELASTEREVKGLETDVSDLETDVSKKQDIIATLVSEIEGLQQDLADLDKSVAEATEQRKKEHAEYVSTSASNQAALELIEMAKNRMVKFYKPSLYKTTTTTTVAASPYGFVEVSHFLSREMKKNEGSAGVLAMMDDIIKDVTDDMAEAKHEEAMAQKSYEKEMKDAADKRPADSKLIVEKTAAKATEETNLESVRATLYTTRDQLSAVKKQLGYIHGTCDDFLANFDEKKKERADQVDVLKENAKKLGDASPVFLQQA